MENKKRFNCELCNYNTHKPSDWIKHIETEKHKRDGNKKTRTCNICHMDFFSHWNLKYHNLTTHSTVEERKQQKYYCNDCDQVFFCNLYMQKHMNGKIHKNLILALKLEKELIDKINATKIIS
jgi:hypothetical protein